MAERKQAVVVGVLGVIGRYIVERLLKDDAPARG
jgi:nucleoside-diphosphate-sugar epimerase